MSLCYRIYQRLNRRKTIRDEDLEKTELARCLSTLDLTALGIGSTLGAGAYVIAGKVAKSEAGPAVVISFFIAAVASILAGLCYSEFGARVPKAGSAYIYTYVSIGEILAFVIGWNLILEYVIGSASIARTASGYVDAVIGDVLVPWFNQTMPINVPHLAPHFDLLAVSITLVLTVILACGAKESVTLNKVFTGLNLCILSYVMIAGAFKDDPQNWNIPAENVPNQTGICSDGGTCGVGGFMPYGLSGIIKGAATCFYAFIGFDVIATTGEEAERPKRSIPLATIISLGVVFVMYFGVSLTITMMAPYYELDTKAPFAAVFFKIGWIASKYIVSVGAICALTTSLLGSMFPLPRIVLAMARDGLIFKVFAKINNRFKTPTVATLFSGGLAALLAGLFDVDDLVEMMAIGTLLAYSLVAASVLILRYDVTPEDEQTQGKEAPGHKLNSPDSDSTKAKKRGGTSTIGREVEAASKNIFARILHPNLTYPNHFTSFTVKILLGFLILWITVTCVIVNFLSFFIITKPSIPLIIFLFICLGVIALTLWLISRQPQSCKKLFFTVPFVPLFPALSISINILLMMNLKPETWIRFFVWMFLGFIIYFAYGIRHSSEEKSAYRIDQPAENTYESEGVSIPSHIALEEVKHHHY